MDIAPYVLALKHAIPGRVVINDGSMQFTAEDLPLGGIDASRNQGEHGFRRLGQARAALHQTRLDLAALADLRPATPDACNARWSF